MLNGHKLHALNMSILLYVVCHDNASQGMAEGLVAKLASRGGQTQGRIVRVNPESVYFESQVFEHLDKRMEEWIDARYVGVITYSIEAKMGVPVTDIAHVLEAVAAGGAYAPDVATLNNLQYMKMKLGLPVSFIEGATIQHGPYFLLAYRQILKTLGYTERQMIDPGIPAFFCNWWAAKPQWMQRYVRFYAACRRVIDKQPEVQDYLMQHSYYTGRLPQEVLQRISGKSYYTLHPFLFERLPCFYFHAEGARVAPVLTRGTYELRD